jgi:hypothetical protein
MYGGPPPLGERLSEFERLIEQARKRGEDPDNDRVCRRCDQPKARHMDVPGIGLACPRQVFTFEP